MDEIERLQEWYRRQCDGDWEHSFGVKIDTLDNPGWSLSVNLSDTSLEGVPFDNVSFRVGENAEPDDEDWYVCRIEGTQFRGFGGPHHLKTLLQIFLRWAEGQDDSH